MCITVNKTHFYCKYKSSGNHKVSLEVSAKVTESAVFMNTSLRYKVIQYE